MNLFRFAILIGFLLIEATVMSVSLIPESPSGSPKALNLPNLPVLAKETAQTPFHARFVQTEPIIEGDTFYYSNLKVPLKRTETHHFEILFDFDSSQLNKNSQKILDTVATIAKRGQQIRIFATGHADTSGPDSYNQMLSRQRVEAVLKAFVERGITPGHIDDEAFGEKRLRVMTPDNAPDSRNRRVEIIVGPAPEI